MTGRPAPRGPGSVGRGPRPRDHNRSERVVSHSGGPLARAITTAVHVAASIRLASLTITSGVGTIASDASAQRASGSGTTPCCSSASIAQHRARIVASSSTTGLALAAAQQRHAAARSVTVGHRDARALPICPITIARITRRSIAPTCAATARPSTDRRQPNDDTSGRS